MANLELRKLSGFRILAGMVICAVVASLAAIASFCNESQNSRIKTGVRAFFQFDLSFFS